MFEVSDAGQKFPLVTRANPMRRARRQIRRRNAALLLTPGAHKNAPRVLKLDGSQINHANTFDSGKTSRCLATTNASTTRDRLSTPSGFCSIFNARKVDLESVKLARGRLRLASNVLSMRRIVHHVRTWCNK
jgi:hypothetical protein